LVAGVELTLLDSARYFHKAAGINGAAQIAHDLGAKADVQQLFRAKSTKLLDPAVRSITKAQTPASYPIDRSGSSPSIRP